MKNVEIFTDGACKGNPGPGGWGAILRLGRHEKELSGHEAETTNNRMEMTAAIRALNALTEPCAVTLHTDSRYVIDGMTKWIEGWKRKGWINASKQPVRNADLWHDLIEAAQRHQIDWQWVKGHNGHAENERADRLASAAALRPSRVVRQIPVLSMFAAIRRRRLFDHFGRRSVLQDRVDRVLRAGLALVAFGPEDRFLVEHEIGDELALLVLPDFETMSHGIPPRMSDQGAATLTPASQFASETFAEKKEPDQSLRPARTGAARWPAPRRPGRSGCRSRPARRTRRTAAARDRNRSPGAGRARSS